MGKWIGQHIYDLVARFRSDVYLDDIQTGEIASGGNLGLNSNNKIVKATEASGDITAVTITTDSGGGSAASDTGGSADFSILGSSGVGVTNSGTTITAVSVPGEIDHDSLLNFVAAEHYAWASDISGTATIHTNNITDLHGAGVDGAITQILTDNGSGGITSQAYASFRNSSNISELSLFSNEDTGDRVKIETTTHGATTLTTIDDDAAAAHFEIAADGNITLDAAGDIALEAAGDDITMEAAHITLESTAANDPTVTIQTTANDVNSPRIRFFKRRESTGTLQAGQDGDGAGEVLFNSYNDAATPGGKTYAKIEGFIHDATNGQESGQLKLQVASHDAGVETGILLTGGSVDAEVDVTIGNGTASVTSIAGSLRPKGQIHITHHSFTADIDTTKNYVGLADADSESTGTTGIDMPLVFPMASKLLQVTMRSNKNLSGLTYTFRLETQATGVGFATGPTIVGTQSGTGPTQPGHAVYDFTTSLDSGDNLIDAFDAAYLSIQSGGSTANTKYYITCVWETDLSGY